MHPSVKARTMKACQVKTVLLPYSPAVGLDHAVQPEDRLTQAVKTMLSLGVKHIAVIRSGRPIGIIRLEDALTRLGLPGGLQKSRPP
jgi:hypothetical protein